MSQLVSARLLSGPASFARATSKNFTCPTRTLTSRQHVRTSTTRVSEQTFFVPSFDRSTLAQSSASSGKDAYTLNPSTGLFFVNRARWHERTKQQKIASSIYAPSSDDPEVTVRQLTHEEIVSAPTLSPGQALLAGYRPVGAFTASTLPRTYRQLAKAQLTFLVTLTAMAGYALCPTALATSTSITTLLSMTAGTALCSASANALNQLVESPYDAQMPRTRNRPLPSRSVTPLHAASFATLSGVVGVGALTTINPLTALLGLANIVLYSGVYTPMKRVSITNTWIGSVVGAIPPLIGWTACTGTLHLATDAPGWTLAALLFAWQFPHFNSLAHTLRREYARGGYRMMSVTDPALNRRTSLRYAISLFPICSVLLPWTGVVHWSYALLSAPINAAMVYAAYGFWRMDGDKPARQCFWISLMHLPAVLLLAMGCKTDVIEALQRRLGLATSAEDVMG